MTRPDAYAKASLDFTTGYPESYVVVIELVDLLTSITTQIAALVPCPPVQRKEVIIL